MDATPAKNPPVTLQKRPEPPSATLTTRGRAAAVRAFCRDCMGGSAREVRECPAPQCALWPYRLGTYQRKNP